MGMQCQFAFLDLHDNNIPYHVEHDEENDIKTVTITRADIHSGLFHQFTLSGDHCWFDVGSWTPDQSSAVAWLVWHRICFSCA